MPESDLAVKFDGFEDTDLDDETTGSRLKKATGDRDIHMARFAVRQGRGMEKSLIAVSRLPHFPNSSLEEDGQTVLRVGYFHPPSLSAKGGPMSGRFAQVEFLEDDAGTLYMRAFGRDGLMGTPGPIRVGELKPLATSTKMMSLAVKVEESLPKARLRQVYVPVSLPRERRDEAKRAIHAEMTIDGVTRKLSLLAPLDLDPANVEWETIRFPSGTFRVAYDWDRKPFPFTLYLSKFEPGKDPGSGSFATYRSEVELSDPELGLNREPRAIFMNNPLTHRRWSLYQSNFYRARDPETGEKDGAYASIFQVHYDPGWEIIYGGCLLVVIGTFLQFYMRAGLFTDGGKLEKQRAEARAAKRSGKANGSASAVASTSEPRSSPEPDAFEAL